MLELVENDCLMFPENDILEIIYTYFDKTRHLISNL